ncbi:tetratricopeptide repeat protein [Kutzneria buriramensis]|uniref:Tetratricopeptide repeat protein n=1 Tax=Kutzneria buriramensis TaxID=1045776 RepID=A0A3E0H1D1_9PSEU|nr:tetratricopeptide repeat protein [Kutzneria buriramensis]
MTDPGPARPASLTAAPVVWGGVPPRNLNFTGREQLLDRLHESLVPGTTAAIVPHALHGMGGVGKSQLAIEYVYRHQADFEVIWWVPAEHDVQIRNSLAELAQRMNVGVGVEPNVAVQIVLDALRGGARWRIPSNWLLVFDNAESVLEVMPYLPTGGPGRILVTSRNLEWRNQAHGLEVDVFMREESRQLLQRRGPELTDKDADQLAAALGDLPLAIEQAAAWRAVTGMPAGEYLQLLEEKQDELLNVSQPTDYPSSVGMAWNLSLERLADRNPTALRILQVAAVLAPEPISLSLFTIGRSVSISPDLDRGLRDRLRLNEAIRDINRYSLARVDHRTNSIQIHRLVRSALQRQMTEDEYRTLRHGAHLLLAASDPNMPGESDQRVRYAELFPHVTASNAIECDDPAVRDLIHNIAVYLFWLGDHRAALEFSHRVYDIRRAELGEDDPETLRIGRWLGLMLRLNGHHQRAAALDDTVVEISRRVLGVDHEGTIEALNSVAGDLRMRGEFTSALELSRSVHATAMRALGPDEPVTLDSAHSLGVSLRLAGEFAEALELDTATLRQMIETYGADHAKSLITQIGMALDSWELGDCLRAGGSFEDVVARSASVHGERHPLTSQATRLLAEMRRRIGDRAGAVEAAEQAVDSLSWSYGESHPEVIAAKLCLSIAQRHASNLDAAQRVGDEAVARYRDQLGDTHPHSLTAMVNQAVLLRLNGDPAAARDVSEAGVAGLRDRVGAEHPSTLAAAINLANDLFALRDFETALTLDTVTREACARVLGADHPTTSGCAANLALDLIATGSVDEGQRLRAEAVAALTGKLGPQHPAVLELSMTDQRFDCDVDPLPL